MDPKETELCGIGCIHLAEGRTSDGLFFPQVL